jgi:hypothetical protein
MVRIERSLQLEPGEVAPDAHREVAGEYPTKPASKNDTGSTRACNRSEMASDVGELMEAHHTNVKIHL